MEQFAYYVNFHDKKSNGHSFKVFVNFSDIEEYTKQGNRTSIERIPIVGLDQHVGLTNEECFGEETLLSDGSRINLNPMGSFESPTLSSSRSSHMKLPGCNVNSTGVDYRA